MTRRVAVGAGLASLALFVVAFLVAGGGSAPASAPVGREVPVSAVQTADVPRLRSMPALPNLPAKPKPKAKARSTTSAAVAVVASPSAPAASSAPAPAASAPTPSASKPTKKSSGGSGGGDVCFGPLC